MLFTTFACTRLYSQVLSALTLEIARNFGFALQLQHLYRCAWRYLDLLLALPEIVEKDEKETKFALLKRPVVSVAQPVSSTASVEVSVMVTEPRRASGI